MFGPIGRVSQLGRQCGIGTTREHPLASAFHIRCDEPRGED
jgi:hypothetical protein